MFGVSLLLSRSSSVSACTRQHLAQVPVFLTVFSLLIALLTATAWMTQKKQNKGGIKFGLWKMKSYATSSIYCLSLGKEGNRCFKGYWEGYWSFVREACRTFITTEDWR